MIKTVFLRPCPFCGEWAGDISVDPEVVHDLRVSQADCTNVEANHAKVVLTNAPQSAAGACPHVVRLFMEVSWGPELEDHLVVPKWELETLYRCPQLAEISYPHPVRDLLLDFEFDDEHEMFLPSEPHEFDRVLARWGDFKGVEGPGHAYEVDGRVVFARNIPNFFDGLRAAHDKVMAAQKAGRDTHAERREILAQRETESVYEYEEC